MAYGVYADVVALVPELSGVTKPTSTQVGGWLDEISATIDSWLYQQGYTIPVTGANDLLTTKHYTVVKVACTSVQVMSLGENYRQKAEGWCKEYSDFIEALSAGKFKLVNQTATKGGTGIFYLKKSSRGRDYTRE